MKISVSLCFDWDSNWARPKEKSGESPLEPNCSVCSPTSIDNPKKSRSPWRKQGVREIHFTGKIMGICLSVCLSSIYLSLVAPTWSIGHPWNASFHFSFLILYTVGRTPWTGDQPVTRPLPAHRTQTQNKRRETSMSWVGFESTIPVFERAKTFHPLDRAATVIGQMMDLLSVTCK
jgi:hypothetical protein